MSKTVSAKLKKFITSVEAKNPHETEYLQAVTEVAEIIIPFMEETPKYQQTGILKMITEPERVIMFRVPWVDDKGNVQVNRGYRIQFNSALGPYKGGLRFHPSVNLSVLKFLGFEQIFKNSLTTLPLGGGKGGADFDPKGKSDNEVMRFCQSFMTELFRHIGDFTDVPAGDIGVGAREIGFLFGQYKRLKNEFTGVLTGKGREWGGSNIRPEATGYGTVYFIKEILSMNNDSFEGKNVLISGSGNVAQFAVEKVLELGGKVLTVSDSGGYIYAAEGFNEDHLEYLKDLKNVRRGRVREMSDEFDELTFFKNETCWQVDVKAEIIIPCATQNELNEKDAEKLISGGAHIVAEGANMPCTSEAVSLFHKNNVIFAPGKAANAGGVAVSGLEMSQNALRLYWSREEVDEKLKKIMSDIHQKCVEYGTNDDGSVNYVKGANIAGFVKVADAMLAQGTV